MLYNFDVITTIILSFYQFQNIFSPFEEFREWRPIMWTLRYIKNYQFFYLFFIIGVSGMSLLNSKRYIILTSLQQ